MRKLCERKGFALTELLLAVLCSLMIITVAFNMYSKAKIQQETTELIRTLQASTQNIRTYFAFEGKYDGISSVKGTTFYDRDFLSHEWKCTGTNTTCIGPQGVNVKFAATKSSGSTINDAFIMTLSKIKGNSCVHLAHTDWKNIISVKVNSTTYSGKNVPVSTKNATSQCKKVENTLVITLQ